MREIILASASPRRAELLRQIGVPFRVAPSRLEGPPDECLNPREFALKQAGRKVGDVAVNYPYALVLGADTVVCCAGKILGKPGDSREAAEMLRLLSGRTHEVSTGVALRLESKGHLRSDVVTTQVTFRCLNEQEIAGYLATGEPFDKAGGYGIQGYGALLVEKIEGCYSNVVGLPLVKLGEMLKEFGVDLLCQSRNTVSR